LPGSPDDLGTEQLGERTGEQEDLLQGEFGEPASGAEGLLGDAGHRLVAERSRCVMLSGERNALR
jgi:hypothetical protein